MIRVKSGVSVSALEDFRGTGSWNSLPRSTILRCEWWDKTSGSCPLAPYLIYLALTKCVVSSLRTFTNTLFALRVNHSKITLKDLWGPKECLFPKIEFSGTREIWFQLSANRSIPSPFAHWFQLLGQSLPSGRLFPVLSVRSWDLE